MFLKRRSRHIGGKALIAVLVLVSVLPAFVAPVSVAAQEEPAAGILTKGPEFRRGIEVLYPNAIPCFYGEYSYGGETVRIFYTEEPVAVRDSWEPFPCSGTPLLKLPGRRDPVLYYEDERDWKVFFLFPSSMDEGAPCRFIGVFLARLSYFKGITGNEQIVPLPAVLRFQ